MTNVEQLVMQMEFDDGSRRRLALDLLKLRRLEAACKSHRSRLPHQVQTALRIEAQVVELDPPADGMPGLFSARPTVHP